MRVLFEKEKVSIDGIEVFSYQELEKDDGTKPIYKLLKRCVEFDGKILFEYSNDCTPFGKKLMSIISVEFKQKED